MDPMDEVLARLRAIAGAEAALDALAGEPDVFAVGGSVRDALLERTPRELDLVVEGDAVAAARRAAARLGGDVVVHERFGTATVRAAAATFDLAGARRERYARPGALPDVELGATLAEDLARRDFTVNAIALRLADVELVPYPGALEDLEARRLRVLHDRSFVDDPTRMLRLARYAARLGFSVEPTTRELLDAALAGHALETVTGPRIGAELRLAGREPQPEAVALLDELGVGAAAVHAAFAVDPERVVRALELAPDDARGDLVALAAACLAAPGGDLAFRLDVLGFPARERDTLVAAATSAPSLADRLVAPDLDVPSRLWALLRREEPEAVALAGALTGPGGEGRARRWLDELRHVRLEIRGDQLTAAGITGPPVGRALEAALAAALDGRATTADEQLAVALAAVRDP
jgi:tRNA nucleotidyltransferase (CCA-adding enzyme)